MWNAECRMMFLAEEMLTYGTQAQITRGALFLIRKNIERKL